jgi:hypothetical protein
MKTNSLLICILLFFGFILSSEAQVPKISIRGEKVLVNNQLYGYLVKDGSVWIKDFSFQSKRNEEIAYARAVTKEMANGHVYDYYEITFKGYSQKAEMDMDPDFGKRFAFEMVLYNIVKDDLANPEKVAEFLERYPPVISKRLSNSAPQKNL